MEAQKVQKELNEIKKDIEKTKQEMSKIVVGQIDIIDGLFRALLANGHVLVEGVPGVAKTLIIRTLGAVTGCQVGRIKNIQRKCSCRDFCKQILSHKIPVYIA